MSEGLNKAARLQNLRARLQKESRPLPLNPPFPYQVESFPADFFGIANYSDAPPDPALTPDQP